MKINYGFVAGGLVSAMTAATASAAFSECFTSAPGSYNPYNPWTTAIPVTVAAGSLSHPAALASVGNRATSFSSQNKTSLSDPINSNETAWGSFMFRFTSGAAQSSAAVYLQNHLANSTSTPDTSSITARPTQMQFRANGTNYSLNYDFLTNVDNFILFSKTPQADGSDQWKFWLNPVGSILGTPNLVQATNSYVYDQLRASIGTPSGAITSLDEIRLGSSLSQVSTLRTRLLKYTNISAVSDDSVLTSYQDVVRYDGIIANAVIPRPPLSPIPPIPAPATVLPLAMAAGIMANRRRR